MDFPNLQNLMEMDKLLVEYGLMALPKCNPMPFIFFFVLFTYQIVCIILFFIQGIEKLFNY